MTATTATTYGADFSYQVQIDGIIAYVDGDDTRTGQEKEAIADALFSAMRDGVDAGLPEGITWQPHTSEFLHPVGTQMPTSEEMEEVFAEAWRAVESRYDEIERKLFGELPVTIDDLEDALRAIEDPVRRARVAGLLVDARMRQMAGRVRAQAIYAASRDRAHEELASLLGTGVPAVRKAIFEHNRQNTGTARP